MVAFSIAMTTDAVTVSAGSKVESWELVRTSIGGGFNPTTSEFVCPSDGTYYFSLDVATRQGLRAELIIVHEDSGVASALGLAEGGGHGSASNSVIIQCTNGERVWVRCDTGYTCYMMGNQGTFTSFLGFRLGD